MVKMNGAQVLCGYQGGQAPKVLARLLLFWVGPVVELRPIMGLISALGGNLPLPPPRERMRSLGGGVLSKLASI